MIRKVLVIGLMILKKLLFRKEVTLVILAGLNKGLRWRFNRYSNSEFILGNWESIMQNVFVKYLKQNDVVYDLGAHQGFLSLLASRLVGNSGKVYSFEPLPQNFQRLQKHIQLNNISNCSPFWCAVSDKSGTIDFTISQSDVSNTYVTTSPAFGASAQVVEVPTYSLDDLVLANRISLPDFIKIDVEGAELDVLKGANHILNSCRPVLYLETHDVHKPGVEKACLEYLLELGYLICETIMPSKAGFMAAYILKHRENANLSLVQTG